MEPPCTNNTIALDSDPVITSESDTTVPKSPTRRRISKAGINIMKASEAKWGCLKSLGSADAQYNVESVLNWFKRARGAENRKNKTKVRGSSIAAATASQELPRNPLYPSLSSVVIEQLTVLYNVMIADQPSRDMHPGLDKIWSTSDTFLAQGALPHDIRNWITQRDRSALRIITSAAGMRVPTIDYPANPEYAHGVFRPESDAFSCHMPTPNLPYPTPSLSPAVVPPALSSLPSQSVDILLPEPQSDLPLGLMILQSVRRAMSDDQLQSGPDHRSPQNCAEFQERFKPWEEKMNTVLKNLRAFVELHDGSGSNE
ncbi:hypothetical protein B0H14DRAFT_2708520 [Mycena olivaceomarginata]|nr:hypothetical protein B0H14DRAFT_2708520 [Mycena olivaceomarginata]